jgi:S1-C subfamily serine protease
VTGYGSGVIISPDGYIITNNHVVEDSDSIGVILNDKTTYKAKLIGRDPDTDIALIKVPATGLPVIKFGNSDELRLGQWVLAVGNPFNLGTTVTAGIISAKGRSLEIPGDNEFKLDSYIQTDAALNPGNSGGALVNTRSELVGITAAIISPTGAYSGNSFAIPGNTVKKVAYDLLKYGKVQRGILGLSISEITPELSAKEGLKNINGVFVLDVATGSGAADAGIKARDVILKVESTSIGSPSEFQEQVSLHSPGDRLNITYLRKGAEKTVPVTLKEQKAAKP